MEGGAGEAAGARGVWGSVVRMVQGTGVETLVFGEMEGRGREGWGVSGARA